MGYFLYLMYIVGPESRFILGSVTQEILGILYIDRNWIESHCPLSTVHCPKSLIISDLVRFGTFRYAAMAVALTSNTGPRPHQLPGRLHRLLRSGCRKDDTDHGTDRDLPRSGRQQLSRRPQKCIRLSFPGAMIHKLSHSPVLFKPSTNNRAQGPEVCKRLSASQAIINVDTFDLRAQSIGQHPAC